jgi:hypothetical protein
MDASEMPKHRPRAFWKALMDNPTGLIADAETLLNASHSFELDRSQSWHRRNWARRGGSTRHSKGPGAQTLKHR